ncbi:MAG: PD-(D/E)XK nuclease family protein [Gaiellales bacterium]
MAARRAGDRCRLHTPRLRGDVRPDLAQARPERPRRADREPRLDGRTPSRSTAGSTASSGRPGPGFRVVDYKTGRAYGKAAATLERGRRLQLPVYLLAGRLIAGAPLERGRAEYLHASRRDRFRRIGMEGAYLAERLDGLRDVLGHIVGGIAGGDFHLEPSERECRWCAFRGVCPIARERLTERKAGDPRVVSFRELREIE